MVSKFLNSRFHKWLSKEHDGVLWNFYLTISKGVGSILIPMYVIDFIYWFFNR